jgi:hypothetical protein
MEGVFGVSKADLTLSVRSDLAVPSGQRASDQTRRKASDKNREEHTKENTVNGDESSEEKSKPSTGDESIFARLPDLDQPPERTAYMAQELLNTLGDKHSERFYVLVARKIPEATIRQSLSEIKSDGAQNPAKLFTYKMKRSALERLKQRV